jgi:signal transduction histidine kinase
VLILVPWAGLSATDPPSDPAFPFFAAVIASYSGGAHARRWGGLHVAGFACAFFIVGSAIDRNTSVGDVAFICFFLAGAWAVGRAVRGRASYATALEHHAERLETEREAQAHDAVALERARIARELHDVVAHGISVMVLQVGGVRRLLGDDRARERDVLAGVEESGRQALGELHLLLGMMRETAASDGLDPAPGLAKLGALVDSVRAAGLAVEVVVEGDERPLPRGLDLSAYRIVQEALTNVVKHAGADRATVRVRYGRRRLELEIVDYGAGADSIVPSGGNGLIGMRERAALFGGELYAGPADGGGFEVRARLPLDGVPA